ncbi:MAG TPA: ribosome silencing factor [Flavilitoribacter sp.]|nr:ribosome silencing factor [Lewinella sp.]MCB9280750.1 ribosome silencing factor [Lewinellaceae bacterium]HMQ64055.1 ribosome silencing factor [Flavilitoribacter sp.]HMQ90233.1 ribosome silencing factor [Flavilitoribacter sp.]
MNTQARLSKPKPNADSAKLNDLIIDSIQDIKGKKIVQLDLRHIEEAPADFFIICEGESNTQVKGITDNIHRRVKEEARLMPNHIEGEKNAHWICIDYFSTVVHVFYRETRGFYDLEHLWSDARFTEFETL